MLLLSCAASDTVWLPAQNGKGWQGASARVSDEAAQNLITFLRRQQQAASSGSKFWTVAPMIGIGAISILSASTEGGILGLISHPRIVATASWVRHTPAGDAAAAAVGQVSQAAQPFIQQATDAAEPYVSAAVAAAAPAVQQARTTLDPLVQEASKFATPIAQEVSRVVSGVMHEVVTVTEPVLQQAAGWLGFPVNATRAL